MAVPLTQCRIIVRCWCGMRSAEEDVQTLIWINRLVADDGQRDLSDKSC